MPKLSESVKNFAAIAGVASAFVVLPALAQTMSVPGVEVKPSAPGVEVKPSAPGVQIRPQSDMKPMPSSDTPSMTQTRETGNIIQVAEANGSFKTLTAALKAAGLDKTLASGGPYTVFAPTDAAFAALPEGTVEKLLKPENRATLVKILTYHVVSGENLSTSLKSGQVKTLEGAPVGVNVSSTGVMVNTAKVVKADVKASNGVIHVIDKVMLPPSPQTSPQPSPKQ
jgi:uncharacterized surface protein with fasciclin (FAS1) repeats